MTPISNGFDSTNFDRIRFEENIHAINLVVKLFSFDSYFVVVVIVPNLKSE